MSQNNSMASKPEQHERKKLDAASDAEIARQEWATLYESHPAKLAELAEDVLHNPFAETPSSSDHSGIETAAPTTPPESVDEEDVEFGEFESAPLPTPPSTPKSIDPFQEPFFYESHPGCRITTPPYSTRCTDLPLFQSHPPRPGESLAEKAESYVLPHYYPPYSIHCTDGHIFEGKGIVPPVGPRLDRSTCLVRVLGKFSLRSRRKKVERGAVVAMNAIEMAERKKSGEQEQGVNEYLPEEQKVEKDELDGVVRPAGRALLPLQDTEGQHQVQMMVAEECGVWDE
ncbi:hypothetical protein K458DRAFT_400596 [Lentithecium fluviatile CBS 122367]|uniref:Uncharacterized protein n=1 Tax=Lentithecium fluviatile CBS 122367 TaxID=1168545 RepID=A0A6G1JCV0_9PLEO|nr:hypothetical protein K458DRAFT_400596 [Lentithecium fluviatile CBS 122367]